MKSTVAEVSYRFGVAQSPVALGQAEIRGRAFRRGGHGPVGGVGHAVGVAAMLLLSSRLQGVGFIFQEVVSAGLLLLLLRARRARFTEAVLRSVSLIR